MWCVLKILLIMGVTVIACKSHWWRRTTIVIFNELYTDENTRIHTESHVSVYEYASRIRPFIHPSMSTGPSARTKGAKKRSVYKSHHDPPGIFSTSRHARRRRVRPFDPSFDRPIARSIDRSMGVRSSDDRGARARAMDGFTSRIVVPRRRPPSSSSIDVARRRTRPRRPDRVGSGQIGSAPVRPRVPPSARVFSTSADRPTATDRDRPRPTATGS